MLCREVEGEEFVGGSGTWPSPFAVFPPSPPGTEPDLGVRLFATRIPASTHQTSKARSALDVNQN